MSTALCARFIIFILERKENRFRRIPVFCKRLFCLTGDPCIVSLYQNGAKSRSLRSSAENRYLDHPVCVVPRDWRVGNALASAGSTRAAVLTGERRLKKGSARGYITRSRGRSRRLERKNFCRIAAHRDTSAGRGLKMQEVTRARERE